MGVRENENRREGGRAVCGDAAIYLYAPPFFSYRHGALVECLGVSEICPHYHGTLLVASRLFRNPFVAPLCFCGAPKCLENLSVVPWHLCGVPRRLVG